jgi:PAS domain S-box-containing protein
MNRQSWSVDHGGMLDADAAEVSASRQEQRTMTREETPSYPAFGPTSKEKAAPRASPIVSLTAADDQATAEQLVAASFWGGTPFHVRYWRHLTDGSCRWTEVRTEPLHEPSGTRQWSGFRADIDDPKPRPQQPTKTAFNPPNEDDAVRAAKAVERLLGNAWAFDAAGRPTYLTPIGQTLVGATLEEFQAAVDEGHTFFKRTSHPDEYDRVAAAWRHSLQTGDHFYIERRIRRATDIHDWSRTAIVPTRDSQGRITGWYGGTIDLDAQRRTEAELRERERELSHLVDMVPSHIWRLAPDGEPVFFNKRMVDFLGLDVADMDKPGMSRLEAVVETVHPDDAAEFRDALSRCLASGESFSMRYRLRRADGVYRWMSSGAEPIRDQGGRIVQWYGLAHDIDDQMRADEVLRQSEQRLRHLIDALPAMTWCTTPDGKPSYVNKRFTDVTGATVEDITAPNGSFSLSVIHPDDKDKTAESVRRSFTTGVPYAVQFRQLRRDGSYRWTETRAEALRDDSGNILQWYGVSVDIHDLVTAQEALRARERQLQQLIDAVPAIIFCMTPEGIPSYLNKRHTDLVGVSLNDMIATDGSRRLSLAHPDDREALDQALGRSIKAGKPFVGRYRQRRASGPHRWVEVRVEPLRDDSGNIIQWYGVNIDIHDLVTAQEALQRNERELSQLVDMVPVHIRRLTPEGEPIFFNKRLRDFYGLGVADMDRPDMKRLASIMQTFVHPDEAARLLETARQSFVSGKPFSMKYRTRRADGVYRWVDTRTEPLRDERGAVLQWYVISLDIDDEVRAQETLRESERRLRQLIDAVPVHFWTTTPEVLPSYVNKRYQEHLGINLANFEPLEEPLNAERLRQEIFEKVHPEDAAECQRNLAYSIKTGEKHLVRFRRRGTDGVYRWIESRLEPQRDQDGKIIQWCGVSLDIDDQMRAEEAIRQSERRLQQMIDAVPVNILSFSAAGEPTYINKRYKDYLGISIPHFDTLQEQQRALIHPDDFAEMYGTLKNCFQTGAPFLMRYRRCGKDGIYRWTEGRAEPLRDRDGTILQWYAVSLDIDDEMRAQDALRRASARLAQATQAASLAELSASIAHEVNQPLAAVVFNSHACQRWLSADPPNLDRAKITVERVIRDANAAADVVSRIRALFKQSVERREAATLSGVIAEAHNLMAEEATRRRVRVEVDVASDLPLIAIDRVQVQQVLINLMRNGMDAMESTAGDRVLGMRVRRTGDLVQTEISDRGPGVALPDKIFEPFFTTKDQGMGMGLAICRSIVESHGGRLWTERNEPHGATFIFTLPVEAKTAT